MIRLAWKIGKTLGHGKWFPKSDEAMLNRWVIGGNSRYGLILTGFRNQKLKELESHEIIMRSIC